MISERSIDPEHNWFWQQGHDDALDGFRAIVPDETRYPFQASDYYSGYEAGKKKRMSRQL